MECCPGRSQTRVPWTRSGKDADARAYKRLLSDVADDPRMVTHLQSTRDWVLAEKATADALRSAGK